MESSLLSLLSLHDQLKFDPSQSAELKPLIRRRIQSLQQNSVPNRTGNFLAKNRELFRLK